ncbi:MAG: hypothetical protein E6K91_04425 [Thaumarchaeota archaeon]|nr:MAG: hypothetical protein E6K91_04425 [Nitrososphaerota archaeon]
MKKIYLPIFVVLIASIFAVWISIEPVFGEGKVPTWVKNVITWWSQGQVSDDEFLKGIKFLVENNIIQIESSKNSGSEPIVTSDKTIYSQGDTITISGTGFADGDVVVVVGNYDYLAYVDTETNKVGLDQTDLSELSVLAQYQYSDNNLGNWAKRPYPAGLAISTRIHADHSGNWQITLKEFTSTDKDSNGNEVTSSHFLPPDQYIVKVAQKIYQSDDSTDSGYKNLSIRTAYTNITVE